jgi:hypothetical protein
MDSNRAPFQEDEFRREIRALRSAGLLAPKEVVEPLTDRIDSMFYGDPYPSGAEMRRRLAIVREEFAGVDALAAYGSMHEDAWDAKVFTWKYVMSDAEREAFVVENLPEAAKAVQRLASPGDFTMLWDENYYDGPLSGFGRLADGWLSYFSLIKELDEPSGPRIYGAYGLTSEQAAEANKWHDLFREKVGEHCDYDYDYDYGEHGLGRRRGGGTVRPEAMWKEYYDAAKGKEKMNPAALPLIGWFW